MSLNYGPLDRAPRPVAIAGVAGLVATIAAVKGVRRLPAKAMAGLHIGLPIRWHILAEKRGVAYGTVADTEIEWFATRLTEFLLSLPRWVLLLLVGAFLLRQLWRVTHPPTPEADTA